MSLESQELVPVSAARAPDEYERKYMPGEGLVLYRDKSRAPWQIHALFGGSGALAVVPALAFGQFLAAAFSGSILLLMWMLFSVLRVTVSEGHVNVQYGLFGPRIPIAAIESAEAIRYDWKSFGGWGIRHRRGEWLYNMPGDGGRAVRIVWRGDQGQRHVTLIGSRNAEELALKILQSRDALSLPAADKT